MRHQPVTSRSAFEALADETRRAVLDHLREAGEQPAGAIAHLFPVSRPAISKHLRILRDARLVRHSRRGRHRVYRLDPAPLAQIDRWLAPYRAFWTTRLTELKGFVESRVAVEGGAASANRRRPRRKR